MRIELPSWEVAPLSRRRKRQTKENGSPSWDGYRAHFFVRHHRARTSKKARTDVADDVVPLVVLTSETKIEVVGLSKGELSVSQSRQFACRPGTTFLPKKDPDASAVSAVMDKRNDLVFALQNENRRLICWPSSSDNLEDAVHTSLPESAVSLDVMPGKSSYVFGTLQGSKPMLFLASFDRHDRKIDIKSFDIPGLQEVSQLDYVTTTVHVVDSSSWNSISNSPSAQKRKSAAGDAEEKQFGPEIIQLFASRQELYFVRHQILGDDESNLSSFERLSIHVHKVPLYLGDDTLAESTVSFVGFSGDTVALSYRTESRRQFLVSLSFRTKKVVRGPFEIDTNAKQISLMNSHVAVAQIHGDIALVDTLSGVVLQRTTVPHYVRTDKAWRLLGLDSRKSRVLVLFQDENEYNVASAIVSLGERNSTTTVSLASRLSLLLESQPESLTQHGVLLRRQSIPDRESEDGGYTIANATKIGLQKLELAFNQLATGTSYTTEPGFVTKAYSDALVPMVTAASAFSPEARFGVGEKQSPDKPMNFRFRNGTTSGKRTPNGLGHATMPIDEQKRLHEIPSSLVVVIGSWAVRILSALRRSPIGSARDETRVILKKVLRSKKASARSLFDSSAAGSVANVLRGIAMVETEKCASYSPVDLLFDMLAYCQDVSERHMVSGVQYMLLHASVDDITRFFESKGKEGGENNARDTHRGGKAVLNGVRAVANGADAGKGSIAENVHEDLCYNLKKECDAEKWKNCSFRLEMRGAAALLMAIWGYSDLNEALLRRSVADTLSRDEICLCLKLIIRMRREVGIYRFDPDSTRRAFIWVSALCAGLIAPVSPEEIRLLKEVRVVLAQERNGTNLLLGFRKFLDSTISGIHEADEAAKQPRSHLSPYQVERLVF